MKTVIIIIMTWCPHVYDWHLCGIQGRYRIYVADARVCDEAEHQPRNAPVIWMVPVETFPACLTGPIVGPMYEACSVWDANSDGQVDLRDVAEHWSG